MTEKALKQACETVERFARSIGRDCEVIFLKDNVQVAPLNWSGCVTASDLYRALRQAYEDGEEK